MGAASAWGAAFAKRLMAEADEPMHRLTCGCIVPGMFLYNSQIGYFFNTTFARIDKVGDQLGASASFEDCDLPSLAKAASDVHSWSHSQNANAAIGGRGVDLTCNHRRFHGAASRRATDSR